MLGREKYDGVLIVVQTMPTMQTMQTLSGRDI